jgi:Flp pilus assembly CpaE family ATPase
MKDAADTGAGTADLAQKIVYILREEMDSGHF